MNKDLKTKITWSRVFAKELKVGDFCMFLHGKVIWRVNLSYSSGHLDLTSCKHYWGRDMFLRTPTLERVYQVPKDQAFLYVMKYCPGRIRDFFSIEDLLKIGSRLSLK